MPADLVKQLANKDELARAEILKRMFSTGTLFNKQEISKALADQMGISYWRRAFYKECEQCSTHPYVSGALELYVDAVCATSAITNRSVWITSDDKKIENTLNQMLDAIQIEERIRDWAGTTGMFGDFMPEIVGEDGIGVAFIDDALHPADVERVDINGRLEGFVRTGLYSEKADYSADLEPPWKYVHFRTFGVIRRALNTALGIFGEPGRMYSLEQQRMQQNKAFRVTTKYGVSILFPAVPIYKRLKMSEDSLMLARMTRGVLWYLYKIKTKGSNPDAMAAVVQAYADYLKRNTGLNVGDPASPSTADKAWKDRFAPVFGQAEDIFAPETDDLSLSVEKMGGEPDIKYIADIDLLTNQLMGSLRVSKSMLGITDDLPGGIGENASKRISINFAKNADRLQAALKAGIKRICQIHLAYMKQNPDPSRFEVNFADISSAEEEEIKDALEKGVDIADKLSDLVTKLTGEDVNKMEILQYVNNKILKLNDFDFQKLVSKVQSKVGPIERKQSPQSSDLFSYLPNGSVMGINEGTNEFEFDKKAWVGRKIEFKGGADK